LGGGACAKATRGSLGTCPSPSPLPKNIYAKILPVSDIST